MAMSCQWRPTTTSPRPTGHERWRCRVDSAPQLHRLDGLGRTGWARTRFTAISDDREIMTWEVFGSASRALAQAVADDGYEPDMVLAIARGGLLIGGAIGYALSVKNVYT